MKRILTSVCAVMAAVAGTTIALAPAAHAAQGCRVDYTVHAQWPGQFLAGVTITNLGDPVTSWILQFQFNAPGQHLSFGWSASWFENEGNIAASSLPWNGALGTNASTAIGFIGTWSEENRIPAQFFLNGAECTGVLLPTRPPVTPTTRSATPPVNDPIPIVEWVAPANGSTFTAPADILLEANGRSSNGTNFQGTTFLVDGVAVGGDPSPPTAQFLWHVDAGAPGTSVSHRLSARGCTNVGCITTTPVTVTIVTP